MALLAKGGTRYDPAYLKNRVLANGQTFNVGDLVESMTTGFAKNPSAGAASLGVIIAFVDSADAPIALGGVTRSTTAYGGDIQQVVAAADNQTVAMIKAVVCCDPSVVWSATVNGTIGTTATSNLPGVGINIDAAGTSYGRVLETTATRTPATETNFYSHGVDPEVPANLLVSIRASEMFGGSSG